MSSEPLITLRDVSWHNQGASILHKVSLSISAGEIVTLIGPNGAGKSTLVSVLTGLVQPTEGTVEKQPSLKIGFMPQRLQFDSSLPIQVERFLQLSQSSNIDTQYFADKLGVSGLFKSQLRDLSGGELQRVLLTRAVLRKPQLLVLDEPTQGVDVVGQAELYRHISDIRDDIGCGVLMVSHDLHLVMAKTDTVICLNHHVCCHGAPESVQAHPEYIQLFGQQAAEDIAIYTHDHDHQHNLHGDVVHAHSHCDHGHPDA